MISKQFIVRFLRSQNILTYCNLRKTSQLSRSAVLDRYGDFTSVQERGLTFTSVMRTINYMSKHDHSLNNCVVKHPQTSGTRQFHSSVISKNNFEVSQQGEKPEVETEDTDESETVIAESLSRLEVTSRTKEESNSAILEILMDEQHRGNEAAEILEDDAVLSNDSLSLVESTRAGDETIEAVEIPKLYTLAPLVNESEVLQNLVKLGVDLSVIETKRMANEIVKMDFETDIKPYVLFLTDLGVPLDRLGHVLTKCPYLLQHDVEHLKVRVDFLLSKEFKPSGIVQMIDKNATFLCMKTERIDAKLAFYQKEFKLTGDEVRRVITRLSRLLYLYPYTFKDNKYQMKVFLGFTELELKKIFLTYPTLFTLNKNTVLKRFDYLHNVMGIPHSLIVKWPRILRTQIQRIENRHRFLVKCGGAQYDPLNPNYVSLQSLVSETDNIWCVEIAKSSVAEFDQFQRTI